jgi:two-component sensor histidine kinase
MALSHAHNILSGRSWESATIGEIITAVLEPYADGRALARGPQLRLSPRAAIPFAMVINELATNAAKYGALAAPEGAVSLSWTVTGDRLHMEWRESGGKPVIEPTRIGYGTDFIQRAVTHELAGTVDVQYHSGSLSCTITFPVE